ncbi:MAG: DUF1592 domain-containing protein [Planctomycetota bacterium]|nr:DUF1592 domain-containing protein [Planctomycetota bacterium]
MFKFSSTLVGILYWTAVCSLTGGSGLSAQQTQIRQPVPFNGMYEGEFHFKREDPARVQPMGQFGPGWSKNAHLLWDGKLGEKCNLLFQVVHSSQYELKLRMTLAPDYGQFQLLLDGKEISPRIDLYSAKVELAQVIDLGKKTLSAGTHRLTFVLTGANQKAVFFRKSKYLLGMDYLKLTNLNPNSLPAKPLVSSANSNSANHDEVVAFLRTYCVRCHGGRKEESELDLRSFQNRDRLKDNLKLVQQVASAIDQKEMPPPEQKLQPRDSSRRRVANYLRDVIDETLQASNELPVIVMRRLNRFEYNNAVRDLLNLKGDIYPLPEKVIRAGYPYFDPASGYFPDQIRVGNRALGKFQIEREVLTGVVPFAIDLQAEHGFNNRGRELSISPLLLETFLKLGSSIVSSPEFPSFCLDYAKTFELGKESPADKVHGESRNRIANLLYRGFRKPVSKSVLDRYHRFFLSEFEKTNSFSESMKKVVAAILASPRFLFIHQQEEVGSGQLNPDHQLLDDYELASRLSFFLWNSIPDPALLALAKTGKLSDPSVLAIQVHNMLLDPRSNALAQDFARQWLRLDQLITAVPDDQRFPLYYSRIGCEYWKFGLQTMLEPLLLFESVMVEDRPIMELIDSQYSFRSNELQSWYVDEKPFTNRGIVNRFNTNQQDFTRRKLGTRREGGVITTAAVMTMTSSPLRTSPILRGSWFATVILNQPPPPPPDSVPEIEADDAVIEAKGMTLRQRLKQHQENESCASCHLKIDPFGFALENYDATGRWRDSYRSGLAIDSSGSLFGKHEFSNIVELKDVLIKNPEIFTRAFGEHLLSYALARELEVSDKPAIDKIVRNVLAGEGRFSRMIIEVATSYPFRHKLTKAGRAQLNKKKIEEEK